MTITADFSGGEKAVTTEPLYQWDTGQKLALSGLPATSTDIQVHFANAAMAQAIVKATAIENSLPTCDIPNEFLQYGSAAKARAWVFYRASDTEGYTVRTVLIPVTPRKRPNDYVSPEDPDSQGIVERALELLEDYEDDLASKLSAAPGAVDTENLADESITVEKVADDLAAVINAKAPLSTAYTFDSTTTNVVYNTANPKTIYTNALVNGKDAFVLTTANNYYQIALCYDGTEYKRELTAGGSTTYKPWALVNNENSGGVVPQYVIDEAESVLAKAFAHKGLGRTIRFIAVSDSHNDATETSYAYTRVSNQHCGQAVKYIADRIPLDFVASLGDMTWAGVAHTTAQYQTDWLKDDIQEMNLFLKGGFSGVPNIRVVGNHDQCATTDSGGTVSRLQNSGAYQYFGRYNAGVSDGLSNYGYYDLNNVKVRIIYLNTSDAVNVSSQGTYLGMTAAQKNWLCETLIDLNTKTDAASWKILLMSHAPLDMIAGLAADILIPYTNGGTYGSYTFTNHSVKIIGNCHGHTHCYNVGYISDTIRRFTIPNSNFYDNNHYKNNASYAAWTEETTYPKTQNSRTDTSFSLVTIDLDNLTCYVDNYGAGYDRNFSVDYKKPVSSISNLSYTGTTTVGQNIDTSAISYTVNYSDGSTSSRTGNVTVSPVTIQQVGNNTVTVSYTENSTTVTGTLTIAGTAPKKTVSSISNLSYTGTTTVGQNIDTSAISYTVNYSDSSTSSRTGNVTVTPVTIQQVGNNTVTVSYTENSTTVTGTFTIVGTAAPTNNLFDKDDPDVILRARFNSSMQPVDFADEQLVTGFVPASVGTSFTIETDKANNTNGYTGFIMLYNSSKQPIGGLSNATTPFVWSSDYKSGTVTIPQSYINTNFEGTEYARFCLAYVDIDNIEIY